jgi:hypothetical protein
LARSANRKADYAALRLAIRNAIEVALADDREMVASKVVPTEH